MAFDLATTGRVLGRMMAPAGRVAGRAAWAGTKFGVKAGLGLGLEAAYAGTKVGLAVGAGVLGAGLMTARAGFNVAYGTGRWAGRTLGAGKLPFATEPLKVGKRTFNIPHQFNRATQNAIVFGSIGAAGAAGVYRGVRGSNWDLNEAVGSGVIEAERPDFMGATGSLALSLALGKRNRPGHLVNYDIGGRNALGLEQDRNMTLMERLHPYTQFADEAAMMASHMLFR